MDKRFIAAAHRTDEIIRVLLDAGFDMSDPTSIWHIDLPSNISFDSGACRLVVWDDDYCDYVVKFPRSKYDERYCQREAELYAEAEKLHIEEAFAWCRCIYEPNDMIEDMGIYAMEFVECDAERLSDASYDSAYHQYCDAQNLDPSDKEVQAEYDNSYYDSDKENDYLYDLFLSKLNCNSADVDSFVVSHDINDLHCGNMGIRGDVYVLTDYAGYGW